MQRTSLSGQDAPRVMLPVFSEESLALRFAGAHADKLRYVAEWGKWFRWTGNRWEEEKTRYVFDLARSICRDAASACNKKREAKTLASAKTRAAIVSLVSEDRRIAATIDQWDTDLWLLNTPGGVVDLRTGTLRPHRPEDYMSKITAVAPGGDCPQFMGFLDTITAGDKAFQKYLQRMLGYTLTGSMEEEEFYFLYGLGRNGKSTLMNTVAAIMGDYCKTASMEMFTVSMHERHPTELAALRGARLVVARETEENRAWAQVLINQITGGDPITARFMRQDGFTYQPQFKLIFLGNHKPRLRAVNVAIRRRLRLLPFTITIPEDQVDKKLAGKLKKEGPGILAWMIAGCLAWQKEGLMKPPNVAEATDQYLEAEDTLSAWIEDCCEQNPGSHTGTTELYQSWKVWAAHRNLYDGGEQWFAGKLTDAGFGGER